MTSSAYEAASDGDKGAWIGIDLGTSNCACSIWDSTRGRPKVLQLQGIARPRKGKVGRIVPSVVLLSENYVTKAEGSTLEQNCARVPLSNTISAIVGYDSWMRLQQAAAGTSTPASNEEDVWKACVTSIKRLLGNIDRFNEEDAEFLQSLPFDVVEEDDLSLSLSIQPLGNTEFIRVSPIEVLTTILTSMRLSSNEYLEKYTRIKQFQVPGSSTIVTNCIVGVPAHFGQRQRQRIEEACRLAGFTGHVSTIIESTAASMAYGLFVSVPKEKHILVLDMGGGTTDVTIARLHPQEQFSVIATRGDRRLGGDDMDDAILQMIMARLNASLNNQERRALLTTCRKCKEALCGTEEEKAIDLYQIKWKEFPSLTISQLDFRKAIEPWISRARNLIETTVQESGVVIDEVVLVGGVTRVPAIHDMLRIVFPDIAEFCTSLNADSAVAQGAAIQAAIKSGTVPLSEVRCAMMLDALPHPIGVLLPDGISFVTVLEKNAPLPARGYATFQLADAHQPGVTVIAVEDVSSSSSSSSLEQIGEFSFLLRRLDDIAILEGGKRTVDIGMTMETSGEFIVSIFDENDPEHLIKKQKYQQRKNHGDEVCGYKQPEIEDDSVPVSLVVLCIVLFLLYIVAKVTFHDPEKGGSSII